MSKGETDICISTSDTTACPKEHATTSWSQTDFAKAKFKGSYCPTQSRYQQQPLYLTWRASQLRGQLTRLLRLWAPHHHPDYDFERQPHRRQALPATHWYSLIDVKIQKVQLVKCQGRKFQSCWQAGELAKSGVLAENDKSCHNHNLLKLKCTKIMTHTCALYIATN